MVLVLRNRVPVNIAMESHHNEEQFNRFLHRYSSGDISWNSKCPAHGNIHKSGYTDHYTRTSQLGPNIAVYAETPAVEYAPSNTKTEMGEHLCIRALSVVGYGFDSPNQPDAKFFGYTRPTFQQGNRQTWDENLFAAMRKPFEHITVIQLIP